MRVVILLLLGSLYITLNAQDTCYYYLQNRLGYEFEKVLSTNCNLYFVNNKSFTISHNAGLHKINDTVINLVMITRKHGHYESCTYNTYQSDDTFYINGLVSTTQTFANYHVKYVDSFVLGAPAGYHYRYNKIGDTLVVLDLISFYSSPGKLQLQIFISNEGQILKVIDFRTRIKGKILPKRKYSRLEIHLKNALSIEKYRNNRYGAAKVFMN